MMTCMHWETDPRSLLYPMLRCTSVSSLIFTSLDTINQSFHLLYTLRRCRQVLKSILRNQNIILNSDSSYFPIPLQHFFVDVLGVFRVFEIWLDDKFTEIDL